MIPVTTRAGKALACLLFLGSVAVGVGACGSDGPTAQGSVAFDTYATVMGELADLQRFPPSAPDERTRAERADSIRQAILDRHGVTADELLAYAETIGQQPRLMLEVSDRVVAITDSIARLRATGENPRGYEAVETARGGGAGPGADGDSAAADHEAAADREAPARMGTDSPAVRAPRPLSALRELRERRDSLRRDTAGAPPSS